MSLVSNIMIGTLKKKKKNNQKSQKQPTPAQEIQFLLAQ